MSSKLSCPISYKYFLSNDLITGVFNGSDILRLMKDQRFEACLFDLELMAWDRVKVVIESVLWIQREENWRIHIYNTFDNFHIIIARMSLKIPFLHCNMYKFTKQSPTKSNEHIKDVFIKWRSKSLNTIVPERNWMHRRHVRLAYCKLWEKAFLFFLRF